MDKIDSIFDVAIAGGGLAGLSASILLARKGFKVILFEKKSYPFHRVCGEYISTESRPFLQSLGIPFSTLDLPVITKLLVSDPMGEAAETTLDPGGFGISRYRLDAMLARIAKDSGVQVMESTKVDTIRYKNGRMVVAFRQHEVTATVAIGAFGKRANLDLGWKRTFVMARSGRLNNYLGVKYHIRINEPADTIALHNFKNGYCGLSKIEDGVFSLCYLTTAERLSLHNNSIHQLEENELKRNPHLARIFNQAEFLWASPLSISQVSFMKKSQVHDQVLLVGDSAGMITPLCGNGMSMALHGSKLLVDQVARFLQNEISRAEMNQQYSKIWQDQFSRRLQAGRIIQGFFGDPLLSKGLIKGANLFPGFARFLVRQTHGESY